MMNLLSGNATKTFNLLSIGQRGVGKTVFLAGSYAELHANSLTERTQQLWFDCQDSEVQENIETILNYIVQTGQYPPPTMKVTNFNFSLKRRNRRGVETISHFRWWDIPGEICESRNPEFRSMVSASHGCCVFIDAYALVYNDTYLQALEQIIEQVRAIANLVCLNSLKYPFALILTKCDMLEPDPLSRQQLKNGLQPLTTHLDALGVNYQTFYSFIPIACTEGASTLKPTGAADPLLWLVLELSKIYKPSLMKNLLELVARLQPNGLQPQQEQFEGSLKSVLNPADNNLGVKKIFGLYLLPSARRHLFLPALAIFGLVGVVGLFSMNYEWVFQREPKHLESLTNIATLRQRGQFDQAILVMEKLVQQEPERLDLYLHLADLYELTGKVSKAETAYNQVLAQQKNNLTALVGKAQLRSSQGDTKTAEALFAQAEKAAPTNELKTQIRAVAQKTLHPSSL